MPNKRWTPEEDKYLKENYVKTDIKDLANILKKSESAITQRASAFGIKKRAGLPEGLTIDDLERKYKELGSLRKVEKAFGIHRSIVGYYLHKENKKVNKPIRYSWNDDFFFYDTPESFYWAGFIAADGCVKLKSGKYKELSIGLANKDHIHLEKFKAIMDFTGPIHKIGINTGGYKSEMSIRSDKLFNDLARFNIAPKKSLTLEFPQWLVEHPMANHFMRGYFDGDGSFYIPKLKGDREIKQLYFSLRGTKDFLITFKNILEKECEFVHSVKKPRMNSGIYTLEYGGNRKVLKIRDFLYNDSNKEIRLDRKYNIAHSEKFDLPKDFKFKPVVGKNIETGEEVFFNSMKETEKAGFCRVGVSCCCRGKYSQHKGYTWKYAQ